MIIGRWSSNSGPLAMSSAFAVLIIRPLAFGVGFATQRGNVCSVLARPTNRGNAQGDKARSLFDFVALGARRRRSFGLADRGRNWLEPNV